MIGSGLVLNAYAGNGMGISYRSPWAGSQPHFLLPRAVWALRFPVCASISM